MAWGDKITLTGLGVSLSETTNVDADYTAANHYTEWVTLNPGESAHVKIESAFGSTGNDMLFRVVTSLDALSETPDTEAFTGGSVPFAASVTKSRSLLVWGVYKFRVEVRKGGATAGSYTPSVYVRKDGVSV